MTVHPVSDISFQVNDEGTFYEIVQQPNGQLRCEADGYHCRHVQAVVMYRLRSYGIHQVR